MSNLDNSKFVFYNSKTKFKPGFAYIGVPDEIYHSDKCPGYSRSTITSLADEPMNLVRVKDDKPKDHFIFGNIFHMALGEPAKFKKKYVWEPQRPEGMNLNTKEGRAWKKDTLLPFREKYEDYEYIVPESMQPMLKAMQSVVDKYPLFEEYRLGFKEVVFIAEHPEFLDTKGKPIVFKVKVDCINLNTSSLIDLKSIKSTSTHIIKSEKASCELDIQSYLYSEIVNLVLGPETVKHFKFIFVEKTEDNPEIRFDLVEREEIINGESRFKERFERFMRYKKAFKKFKRVERNDGEWESIGIKKWAFFESDEY